MALDAIRQMGLIAFRIRNQEKNFFLFRLRQRFLMPDVHPGDLRQRHAEQLPQTGLAGMQRRLHALIGPGKSDYPAQKQHRETPVPFFGQKKPAGDQRDHNGCRSVGPQEAAQSRQSNDCNGIAPLFQPFRLPLSLRQQAKKGQQRRAEKQVLGGGHHQQRKSGQQAVSRRQPDTKAAFYTQTAQHCVGISQRSRHRTGLNRRIQGDPRVIAAHRAAQPVKRRQQQRMQRRKSSVILPGGKLRRFPR